MSLHDLVKILVKSSLTSSGMILYRSLSEDLVEILVAKILWDPLQQQQVHAGPFMTNSWDSLGGPGMKILVKIFALWKDLVKVLVESSKRSLYDLAQVLVRLLLLVSGTLASYPSHCLGPFAGVIISGVPIIARSYLVWSSPVCGGCILHFCWLSHVKFTSLPYIRISQACLPSLKRLIQLMWETSCKS